MSEDMDYRQLLIDVRDALNIPDVTLRELWNAATMVSAREFGLSSIPKLIGSVRQDGKTITFHSDLDMCGPSIVLTSSSLADEVVKARTKRAVAFEKGKSAPFAFGVEGSPDVRRDEPASPSWPASGAWIQGTGKVTVVGTGGSSVPSSIDPAFQSVVEAKSMTIRLGEEYIYRIEPVFARGYTEKEPAERGHEEAASPADKLRSGPTWLDDMIGKINQLSPDDMKAWIDASKKVIDGERFFIQGAWSPRDDGATLKEKYGWPEVWPESLIEGYQKTEPTEHDRMAAFFATSEHKRHEDETEPDWAQLDRLLPDECAMPSASASGTMSESVQYRQVKGVVEVRTAIHLESGTRHGWWRSLDVLAKGPLSSPWHLERYHDAVHAQKLIDAAIPSLPRVRKS